MAKDDDSRPDYERSTTLAQLGGLVPSFNLVRLISLYDSDDVTLKSQSLRTDVVKSDDFGSGSNLGTTVCDPGLGAIDATGQLRTGDDGTITWRLADVICPGPGDVQIVEGPASFVATPITTAPIFLTTRIVFPDPPEDLIVHVFTWDSNGTPAPKVAFSWRCRVRYRGIFE